jgi:hypothetical protein
VRVGCGEWSNTVGVCFNGVWHRFGTMTGAADIGCW